ncbi:YibE/F family protein [Desertihabitans aurantiacus]|uniref:YibE/F family protein n=1 Tax=Desertihabitans aurantiacus TaxID=2282477 RepID=UPI001E3FA452|nr:YibE/F family protein [Desertihabitans aurantiacus]
MSHTHLHHSGPSTPESAERQRRALRILVVALVPLAVWTLVGLVVMWPTNVEEHIRSDASTYSVEGVTTPEGRIVNVSEVNCDGLEGSSPGTESVCADIGVEMLQGPERGQTVHVTLTSAVYDSGVEVGQRVRLFRVPIPDAPAGYQFSDFSRQVPLVVFTLVFAAGIVAVARLRGLIALVGLAFAGFVMISFMFPALISGSNPVMVGLVGSSAIMFVVLYATHGFSTRTSTALIGTLAGLIVSAALSYGAVEWAHLTGVAAEDDFLLSNSAPDLTLSSVVIMGIIIASLGALNDVTITQASAVWELAETERDAGKIFRRAMRIGRDHIASTVYTIAFATAGASLGVLLLITIYARPFFDVVQQEQFAAEVLRTIVGSIGLVAALPLTTAIGAALVSLTRRDGEPELQPDQRRPHNEGDELLDLH